MNRWGVSDQVPKALIRRIGAKVKVTKVRTMVTTIVRVVMSKIETTIATTTSTGVTIVIEMIGMDPMSLLKIVKLLLGMVEVVCRELKDMLHKMSRRFDASHEHNKELRNDLAGIGQKVDTHAI